MEVGLGATVLDVLPLITTRVMSTNSVKRHSLGWTALVSVVVFAVMTWFLHGSFVHFAISIGLALLIAVAVVIAFVVRIVRQFARRDSSHELFDRDGRQLLFSWFILLSAAIVSVVPGVFVEIWHIDRAQTWAVELVPRLEAWRETHGSYPATLDEIDGDLDGPLLVGQGALHYSASANGFVFDLWTGLLSGDTWSSANPTWRHYR
jgi:hypothetical protein